MLHYNNKIGIYLLFNEMKISLLFLTHTPKNNNNNTFFKHIYVNV